MSSFEEMILNRCCTISGILLRIWGGWLECLCTYSVIESSFLKGRYDLSVLVNVTSRKSPLVKLREVFDRIV